MPLSQVPTVDDCDHPKIRGLIIVDPVKDEDVRPLHDGDHVFLAEEGLDKELFNIRASVCGFTEHDSVFFKIIYFEFKKKYQHDVTAPFSLFGDSGNGEDNDFFPGDLYLNGAIEINAFALRKHPYGQYITVDALKVDFTVHDSREAAKDGLEVFDFKLINVNLNTVAKTLQGGDIIDVSGIQDCNFQARVSTQADAVKFWVLNQDGVELQRHVEYEYPYTAWGNYDE